jgi:serine/threonine protein phosphatase PrpC
MLEDTLAIIGEFAGPDPQFYGLYDNHGGREVLGFLSQTLHERVAAGMAEGKSAEEGFKPALRVLNEEAVAR